MASGPTGGSLGGGDTRAVPVTMGGGVPAVQSERGDDLLYIQVKPAEEQLPPANDSLSGLPRQKMSGSVTCYRKNENSRLCPADRVLRIVDTQANRYVDTRLGEAVGETRRFEVVYTLGGASLKDGKAARASWSFFLNDQEGYQPDGLGIQKDCVDLPLCIPAEGWIHEMKVFEKESTVQADPSEPEAPVGLKNPQAIPQNAPAGDASEGSDAASFNQKSKIDL
ncbi:MAG: hypothetical protein K8R69_04435 [Deltaproteobacteria bacterium]|nr:hypothetical protein [Deltaproteobacteria bacterium]